MKHKQLQAQGRRSYCAGMCLLVVVGFIVGLHLFLTPAKALEPDAITISRAFEEMHFGRDPNTAPTLVRKWYRPVSILLFGDWNSRQVEFLKTQVDRVKTLGAPVGSIATYGKGGASFGNWSIVHVSAVPEAVRGKVGALFQFKTANEQGENSADVEQIEKYYKKGKSCMTYVWHFDAPLSEIFYSLTITDIFDDQDLLSRCLQFSVFKVFSVGADQPKGSGFDASAINVSENLELREHVIRALYSPLIVRGMSRATALKILEDGRATRP